MKNAKTRSLAILLVIFLCMSLLPTVALADVPERTPANVTAVNQQIKAGINGTATIENLIFAEGAAGLFEGVTGPCKIIFKNCEFTKVFNSTVANVELTFDGCAFTASTAGVGGKKCIYLTSFTALTVNNCTFAGTTSAGQASSAGYALDLNIYSTTCSAINITGNTFEDVNSEVENVAISIKTRNGITDTNAGLGGTVGTITGKVTISGNTFDTNCKKIYIGTNPKGNYTGANTTTGNFPVEVTDNTGAVEVYERHLYAKNETAPAISVGSGKTANFGAAAQIDSTYYPTFEDAMTAANAGQTVTVLKDVTVENRVIIDKNLTLDTTGKTITRGGSLVANSDTCLLQITAGTTTVTGGGKLTINSVDTRSTDKMISVGAGAEMILNDVTIETADKVVYALGASDGSIVINDGAVIMSSFGTNDGIALSTDGEGNLTPSTITMNGGTITGGRLAMYLPGQKETVTITSGTLNGGIEFKSGTLNINGGTFNTTGAALSHTANGSEPSTTGYALAVVDNENCISSGGPVDVNITAGTFQGEIKKFDDDDNSQNNKAQITITGGTFSSDPTEFVASGYKASQSGANTWSVSHYVPESADYSAVTVIGSYAATTGAGNYEAGTVVTIDAGSRDGFTFNTWQAEPAVEFANASSAQTTFVMPATATTVTATWTKILVPVHVIGSYAANTGAGNYEAGTVVTIDAGSRDGFTFNTWQAEPTVVFANASSAQTTFVMPATATTVTATWTANSTSGGSSSDGGGTSSNSSSGGAGTSRTVTSPDPEVRLTVTSVPTHIVDEVRTALANNGEVQLVGNNNHAIRIQGTKGGETLTSFDRPLTVTMPLTSNELRTIVDSSKLTLAKVSQDETGALVLTYMGGNYDADKKVFTAVVDETGDYVLLEDVNVQKIELQIGNKTAMVTGNAVLEDVAPMIIENRTMVPLRFVTEILGGRANWDPTDRTVTVQFGTKVLKMTIDQEIDGIGAAPVIRDNRTLVPIRYISEQFDANVIWIPDTRGIVIVK